MKIANKNARQYVQNLHPFQGSNMFATFRTQNNADGTNGPDMWYVVYSYGYHFPMYIHANGKWFANEDRFSRTTTRHQSQARPVTDGTQLNWLSTEWMKRLAAGGFQAIAKERVIHGVA